MNREIKMGRRPVIVLGTIGAMLTIFMIVVGIITDDLVEWLQPALIAILIFGGLLVLIAGNSVLITEEGITLRKCFCLKTKIKFSDFDVAVPRVLAEPDHPVALHLLKNDGTEIAEILLKPYPQKDVSWLLGLSEMNVVNPSG